ncbi:hypothetical protein ACA910_001565 [Epithemia clementina (nom. ined.)]
MKLFSIVFFAGLMQLASAFTSPAFTTRAKTAAFMLDAREVDKLVDKDAHQVSVLECDEEECSMATAWKEDYEEQWHVKGGLQNPGEGRTLRVMSQTDCFTE